MSYFIPGSPEPNEVQRYIRSMLPESAGRSTVPTLLPYLHTKQITDPMEAMQIGIEAERNGWYWSSRLAADHDKEWYSDSRWSNTHPSNCRIIQFDNRANAGVGGDPNIGIVWHDWSCAADGSVVNRLFVSVFGCDHDWTGKTLGNCYTETKCTKCGYSYRTDSSD
jgi:hypothetical protein